MPVSNSISIKITPEAFAKCEAAIEVLRLELEPYLIALTPKERKTIPKMSDKSQAFVEKIVLYLNSNPEFAPPFLNPDELKIDFEAVKELNKLFRPLKQVTSLLDDTIKLSGGEAYTSSLAYYNSVKFAKRSDVLDAKTIYNDLKQRFPQKGKSSSKKESEVLLKE
jgi:hypothetical protein